MRRLLSDYGLFLKEFRRTFHTTGAILPSSPALCRGLARYVAGPVEEDPARADKLNAPRRILEVGPGTGAVTRRIARRLQPQDQLHLVELNDRFVAHLRKLLETDPEMSAIAERTRIIHNVVQDLPDESQYDVIVSGLPLNNFSVEDVTTILDKLRDLLRPGGILSFFEYVAVRRVRGTVGRAAEKQRLRGIDDLLGDLFRRYELRREAIWSNVPPAWVHHVRFDL